MSNGDELKPSNMGSLKPPHMGNGDRFIPDRMGNTYMLQIHKKIIHDEQLLNWHGQILHIISVSDNKIRNQKTPIIVGLLKQLTIYN